MTIQNHTIVTNMMPMPNSGRTSLYLLQEEIIQTTADYKYLIANTNVTVLQTVVQNPPTLFKDPNGAFDVLPDSL